MAPKQIGRAAIVSSIALGTVCCLGLALPCRAQTTTQTYVYDVQGRAVAATRVQPGNSSSFATYNYDAADNRTVRTAQTFNVPAIPSQLQLGEQIVLQQGLVSADTRFRFDLQADGNMAVWFGSTLLWHAGTYGTTADFLAMQSDGNLVLYGPNYSVIWSSGTYGHPGAHLTMQNDGNLTIKDGATTIWSTGTCCH